MILNEKIYEEEKPKFIKYNWNLRKLFSHGAMRIHFYPILKQWMKLKGFEKFKIKGNKLFAITGYKDYEQILVELIKSEI